MTPTPATYITQARANRWANGLLYAELARLSPAQLAQSFGVNFGSILGLMNHTIMADQAWLQRFSGVGERVTPDSCAALTDFAALRALREAEDARIVSFCEALEPQWLAEMLRYANLKGEPRSQPFAICLAHFFNHQTFHRGQIHALLGVLGLNPPDLDLIAYQVAHPGPAA
ncbi:MAG: DinB family protein [Proteobacteria bacterium]|nr:DinB family protein [Pseudomonadota bacterium]